MKKNIAAVTVKKSATNPSLSKKKKLGAFYTPDEVTSILCYWAIRSAADNILEPSFGGCGFLEASRERLVSLGSNNPTNRLFGCDIDKKTFDHLYEKIGLTQIAKKFIHSDFLGLTPSDFAIQKFDVIIGNPPYVSHHNMSARQKKLASETMKSDGFSLKRLASLWAYFVLHSFKFVNENGRMAWILPGSFIYADYSDSIKQVLEANFSRLHIITLGERIFLSAGAEERSVMLLADGWGKGPAKNGIEKSFVATVKDLRKIIEDWPNSINSVKHLEELDRCPVISTGLYDQYTQIIISSETKRLGDIVDVNIGIVTGDNKFFVINDDVAKSNRLPKKSLKPILSRFNLVKGVIFNSTDMHTAIENNKRCLLLDTTYMRSKNGPLHQYISKYPKKLREGNATFKKRSIWHRPNDGRIPDAFFPYMSHEGPRLVLNGSKIICTNTIHRLFFHADIANIQRKLAAISILSTFSQLSAEIEGRSYASGALKIEPSEAKRIYIIMPSGLSREKIEKTFQDIESHMRGGNSEKARAEADKLVLIPYCKLYGIDYIKKLTQALNVARNQRQK